MNYLFSFALLCSTFFIFLSSSLNATLVITQVLNNTDECFMLRIRNATGESTHESIVPAHATQTVAINVLNQHQPHAYIIKIPLDHLNNQTQSQEIQDRGDFISRDRHIAYITHPVGKTARTLYACIPQNPFELNYWYLGIPLILSHYAFYSPGKQRDIFCYLPFTPTATCSTNKNSTTKKSAITTTHTATHVVLCFHADQLITLKLDSRYITA